MCSEAMKEAAKILRDAAVATLVCSAVGIAFNALRPSGIPFVASKAYEIFVPCPEPLGEVEGIEPSDPLIHDPKTLLVDARPKEEYEAWHLDGARNIPFDFLEALPDDVVRSLAASGAARVVVYGDGEDPDSGRELAREVAGRGVRNVFFVKGGAKALRKQGGGERP